jgi:two-component system CheB/CheR fusion protein
LSELLARSSPLPLSEATNGMKVESDHIYVMPQNVNLSIAGGRLRLLPRKPGVPHMPVDFFFRALAENQQDHAIGIVLSGTGSDGTLGLQAIKGEGGITFAQDEKSAKYFGMPGSAMAAGCVDIALPPDGIAHELGRIARHPYVGLVSRPKQPKVGEQGSVEKTFQTKDDELNTLFSLLRGRTGVDFSLYKHSTLKRRILRRMLLHKIDTLAEYLRYLRMHLVEVDVLFNDR